MENSEIFKIMKTQWNILITGSGLDDTGNCKILTMMKRHLYSGSWMNAWRKVRFSKQWKDIGTFWSIDHDWITWRGITSYWMQLTRKWHIPITKTMAGYHGRQYNWRKKKQWIISGWKQSTGGASGKSIVRLTTQTMSGVWHFMWESSRSWFPLSFEGFPPGILVFLKRNPNTNFEGHEFIAIL